MTARAAPEGRVVEIIERPPHPIIGRLLHESGVWLVAPEDKRYGQDVLVPKGATGTAKPGQVVVVELTEPPSLYGQPVGRVKEVLGEIDDPGMEIEIAVRKYGVPHEFSDACIAMARPARQGAPAGQEAPRGPDGCAAGHHRRRGRA
jgi:ribonuclease R